MGSLRADPTRAQGGTGDAQRSRLEVSPLESASVIDHLVENLLRDAGALGQFPTPLDKLYSNRGLRIIRNADPEALFSAAALAAAPPTLRRTIQAMRSRVLGALDPIARVTHLPRSGAHRLEGLTVTTQQLRERFTLGHELGHDVIPWHHDALYLDARLQLTPQARALFEREANYFAASVLLQGPLIHQVATNALSNGLPHVWRLAEERGASRYTMLWHAVERFPGAAVGLVIDRRVLGGPGVPYRFRAFAQFASATFTRRFPTFLSPVPEAPDVTAFRDTPMVLSAQRYPALSTAWEAFSANGQYGCAVWRLTDRAGHSQRFRLEFGSNHYEIFLLAVEENDGS